MKNKILYSTVILFNLFILYYVYGFNGFKVCIFILVNVVFIYLMKNIINYIYVKYHINNNMNSDVESIKEEQEHFIFSTLNTLNYFCRKDVNISRKLILALSNYLRLVFNKSNSVRGDELITGLKSYAYIQSIRLDKNIEFKYNNNLQNYRLKRDPIQEIVESLLSFIRRNNIEESSINLEVLDKQNRIVIYINCMFPKEYNEIVEKLNIFGDYIVTLKDGLVYKIEMDKYFINEE